MGKEQSMTEGMIGERGKVRPISQKETIALLAPDIYLSIFVHDETSVILSHVEQISLQGWSAKDKHFHA